MFFVDISDQKSRAFILENWRKLEEPGNSLRVKKIPKESDPRNKGVYFANRTIKTMKYDWVVLNKFIKDYLKEPENVKWNTLLNLFIQKWWY